MATANDISSVNSKSAVWQFFILRTRHRTKKPETEPKTVVIFKTEPKTEPMLETAHANTQRKL